jgi:hypothetical protein
MNTAHSNFERIYSFGNTFLFLFEKSAHGQLNHMPSDKLYNRFAESLGIAEN